MPVPRPDRRRNTSDRREMELRARCSWNPSTISHTNTSTITVRIAVANVEGTPSTPIFARIAVNAAALAERIAKKNHSICGLLAHYPHLCPKASSAAFPNLLGKTTITTQAELGSMYEQT